MRSLHSPEKMFSHNGFIAYRPTSTLFLNSLRQCSFPKNCQKQIDCKLPLLLPNEELTVYRNLRSLVNEVLHEILKNIGAYEFTHVDKITLRDFTYEYTKNSYSSNSFHQDHSFYLKKESKCFSAWILIDGSKDFQRLEFLKHDPRVALAPNNEVLIPPEVIKPLVSRYGTFYPISSTNQIGDIVIFNGTVPHRASSKFIGSRKSIDFRIYTFKSAYDRAKYVYGLIK